MQILKVLFLYIDHPLIVVKGQKTVSFPQSLVKMFASLEEAVADVGNLTFHKFVRVKYMHRTYLFVTSDINIS